MHTNEVVKYRFLKSFKKYKRITLTTVMTIYCKLGVLISPLKQLKYWIYKSIYAYTASHRLTALHSALCGNWGNAGISQMCNFFNFSGLTKRIYTGKVLSIRAFHSQEGRACPLWIFSDKEKGGSSNVDVWSFSCKARCSKIMLCSQGQVSWGNADNSFCGRGGGGQFCVDVFYE